MQFWWRHRGGESGQERQHVHLQRIGAIAKRALEVQPDAVVGQEGESFFGQGRAEHVAQQALACGLVLGAGNACGVEVEPECAS
jgi:hypothetical protein